MGFPRQEYWSGLPFPSPGDIPDPGMEPTPSAWQVDSLPLSHQGSPVNLGEPLNLSEPWLAHISTSYNYCEDSVIMYITYLAYLHLLVHSNYLPISSKENKQKFPHVLLLFPSPHWPLPSLYVTMEWHALSFMLFGMTQHLCGPSQRRVKQLTVLWGVNSPILSMGTGLYWLGARRSAIKTDWAKWPIYDFALNRP